MIVLYHFMGLFCSVLFWPGASMYHTKTLPKMYELKHSKSKMIQEVKPITNIMVQLCIISVID